MQKLTKEQEESIAAVKAAINALSPLEREKLWSDIRKYAYSKVAFYQLDGVGAAGPAADDYVAEVLEKLLNGDRIWDNKKKDNFKIFLKSSIKGHIGSAMQKVHEELLPRTEEDWEKQVLKWSLNSDIETPEELIRMREDFQDAYVRRLRVLEARIVMSFRVQQDQTDAMIILKVMKEGHTKPSDTARESGLPLSRVIQLCKRLKILGRQIIALEE
ncbi:hypothetical protein [Nitrospira sp. Nam74]